MRERLKIGDPLVIEETQKDYPRYMPKFPTLAGPASPLSKRSWIRTSRRVRPLSIDDQIDIQLVRELEQSGFFNSLYHAK